MKTIHVNPGAARSNGFTRQRDGLTAGQYAYLKARETTTDTCDQCGRPALYIHFPITNGGRPGRPVGRCRLHSTKTI